MLNKFPGADYKDARSIMSPISNFLTYAVYGLFRPCRFLRIHAREQRYARPARRQWRTRRNRRITRPTNFPFIGRPVGRDNWTRRVAKVRPRVKLKGATFKRERSTRKPVRPQRSRRTARPGERARSGDKSTRKSVVIEEAEEEESRASPTRDAGAGARADLS
jgi:hypothetical protein